ncbi:protein-methionine-sulfoxide reductase heme-binding subunit MsrQ [uncultured Tateyamaria sp.]|uniref:protein-methionine-sulfoxide reductase heme-binding subunit MsrQ n=1 Tax=Tateyamaria sp. 1078 TaxID=3417464 RepID=UPI00262FDABC|nr:protein-methionine-sulfoxide reductase heme-binding subunit MsrQ [uncultured Tateyamaria sp.]
MSIADRINPLARKLPTWVVYVLYLLPVPVLLYMAQTGGLGREPVKALEHELGEIAIQLLIIGLCISPLRRFAGVNLLKFRRAFGILAFVYVVLHLLVWAVLDVQTLERVWADIVKRPYITVGMGAFVLMLPLIATSNNRAVRWLGPLWRQVHLLTYPVVLLAAVHFIWVRKGFQIEPILYLAVIGGLLALRLIPKRARVAA